MPNEVESRSGPSNMPSGSEPHGQATPAVEGVGLAKADDAGIPPAARDVPLPQQVQTGAVEALDSEVGASSESTELGAEALGAAQVTQNPLEAEVSCSFVTSRGVFMLTSHRITTIVIMIPPLKQVAYNPVTTMK